MIFANPNAIIFTTINTKTENQFVINQNFTFLDEIILKRIDKAPINSVNLLIKRGTVEAITN